MNAIATIAHGQRYLSAAAPAVVELVHEARNASHTRAKRLYDLLLQEPNRAQDLAYACCNDRFFLLTRILRRKDADHPWIYARCREVEEAPDDHLDLWARYHYKSSIITFAGSIQEILRDPEITICIFSVTRDLARSFLHQIKQEMEDNDLLSYIAPDVFWQDPIKEAPQWSEDAGIVVKRLGNPKEATVEAHGLLNALPNSKHFQLRIYNDVVTDKVTTETATDQIKKITQRWELSQNLGVAHGGRRWHEGTRYHFADTYGVLMERNILKPRIYPATHNGKLTGTPVFLTDEKWEQIKLDQRSTLASQMLQNPLAASDQTFLPEWLRPFTLRPRTLNVYILGDPSKGTTRRSDRTALAVVGVDAQGNRYLLDGMCHRMRLSERWDNLQRLHRKWSLEPGVQHVRVGYERYGIQTDLEYFEEKLAVSNAPMDIVEVNWNRQGGQSKKDRVERLEPYFRNSKFWLLSRIWAGAIEGECLWLFDEATQKPKMVPVPKGVRTKLETQAIEAGEGYRVLGPIKQIDEDRNVYDLTRVFMEEFMMFPFSPRDDLVDAVSRIEDVEVTVPFGPTIEALMLPEPIE